MLNRIEIAYESKVSLERAYKSKRASMRVYVVVNNSNAIIAGIDIVITHNQNYTLASAQS